MGSTQGGGRLRGRRTKCRPWGIGGSGKALGRATQWAVCKAAESSTCGERPLVWAGVWGGAGTMRVLESPQPSPKQAAPAACQSGCSWEWGLSPSWGSHRGPSVHRTRRSWPCLREGRPLTPGRGADKTFLWFPRNDAVVQPARSLRSSVGTSPAPHEAHPPTICSDSAHGWGFLERGSQGHFISPGLRAWPEETPNGAARGRGGGQACRHLLPGGPLVRAWMSPHTSEGVHPSHTPHGPPRQCPLL